MADISKIKSLDGTTTYNVKDATARSLLGGHSVGKDVPSDAVFTDTTYTSKTAASGGSEVSLVTTGEKYTWNNAAKPDMGTVSLSTTWSGDGPYTQTVTVSGATITAASKVDLQPDADGIAQLIEDGVQALYIVNNNGTLTAYSVGAEISTAMTIQCTVTEVVA